MQGGARWADALAKEWAMTKGKLKRFEIKADWKRYGSAAGPIRNQQMLDWVLIWSWPSRAAQAPPAWSRWRARPACVSSSHEALRSDVGC
jgi:hypothetical protein